MLLQITIGFLILQGFFPSKDLDVGVLTVSLSRLFPGMIVLSLNSGAYVAEIIRGGITAVNYGQTEAAHSLGLRPAQTMRYVILPQALRNILPPLGEPLIVAAAVYFVMTFITSRLVNLWEKKLGKGYQR